jgi:DNA helicase II / ATP-dependent DNA helicase PcrA
MSATLTTQFSQFLSTLNSEQAQAVQATEGPVMVLAGPGTGKTQLLSARIAHILQLPDVDASNILCLTYTDAGAVAMTKRLRTMVSATETSKMQISTFHSFCARVISENTEYFGYRNWQPVSDLERYELVYSIIDGLPFDNPLKKLKGNPYQFAYNLLQLFNIMKSESFSPEYMQARVTEYVDDLPNREEFIYKKSGKGYEKGDLKQKQIDDIKEKMDKLMAGVACFPLYCQKLEKANLFDFADMILWVIQAFKDNDNLLARYQETYQYILVDEYQDTNGSQNEILNLLTNYDPENANMFVVGDDDQSIYSFQGANEERFEEFMARFQSTLRVFSIFRNYRSRQEILDTAGVLIDNNQSRLIHNPNIQGQFKGLTKDLVASNSSIVEKTYPFAPVQVVGYHNEAHEAVGVVKEIKKLASTGVKYGDIAILYRNHAQVDKIRQLLDWEKIPYNAKRTENVLEHPLVQKLNLILSYLLKESTKPGTGEEDLFKILHFDFFGCSARDVAYISLALQKEMKGQSFRIIIGSNEKMFQLGLQNAKALASVSQCMDKWQTAMFNQTLLVFLQQVLKEAGIISNILNPSTVNRQLSTNIEDLEVLKTYFSFVQTESDKRKNFGVAQLLDLVQKMEENNLSLNLERVSFHEDGVNLITTHSSKGLEFGHVFLIQCQETNWEKKRENNSSFAFPDTLTHVGQKQKDDNHEELRRLFFVAVTRAKEQIQISYSLKALKDASEEQSTLLPSKFVNEILEKTSPERREVRLPDSEIAEFLFKTLIPELPNEAKLEKQYIDKVLQGFTMSVTKLNDYLACPLSFYYKHILRIPEAKNAVAGYGSAVHEALQELFVRVQKHPSHSFASQEELLDMFRRSMLRYETQFTKTEFELRNEHGKKVLSDYYDHYVHSWNTTVSLELPINTTLDGIPLTGRIDKLEFNGKEANVVDYKTGKPDGRSKELASGSDTELGGNYWRQLVFYKILMDTAQPKGWHMVSGEIDFVEYDKDKSFQKKKQFPTEVEVQVVKEQIRTSSAKIMAHDFYTGCDKEDCVCGKMKF